jgi:hypothetical protein
VWGAAFRRGAAGGSALSRMATTARRRGRLCRGERQQCFPSVYHLRFWSPPSSVGSQGRHGVPCKRTVSGVAGLLCMLLQSLFRASGGRPVLTRQCLCPWVAEWVEWIIEVIIWRGCWFSRCFKRFSILYNGDKTLFSVF